MMSGTGASGAPPRFDRVLVVDWSANSTPKRGADSIWIGTAGAGGGAPENLATRAQAMDMLRLRINAGLAAGARILVAFDIGFGFPRGFAQHLTGQASALAVWDWLARHITDDARNGNNRFEVAAEINRKFPGTGPFWGRPSGRDLPDLPEKALRGMGTDWQSCAPPKRCVRGRTRCGSFIPLVLSGHKACWAWRIWQPCARTTGTRWPCGPCRGQMRQLCWWKPTCR